MTAAHPEAVEIAALTEDLLTAEEAARLRGHLAGCARCTAVLADFDTLREELAALPPVDGIPEDVASRIDAALEQVSRTAGPRATVPHTAVSHAAVSRETADDEFGDSRSGVPQESSEPRAAATRRLASSRHWPRLVLTAVGAVVGLGLAGMALHALGFDGDGRATDATSANPGDAGGSETTEGEGRTAGAANDSSGRTTRARLEAEVHTLLAQAHLLTNDRTDTFAAPESEGHRTSPGGGKAPDAASPRHDRTFREGDPSTPTALPQCVIFAIGRSEPALAATEIAYRGVSAYLVVVPHATDATQVDVYVVDAGCVSADPPVAGTVLTQQSYPLD